MIKRLAKNLFTVGIFATAIRLANAQQDVRSLSHFGPFQVGPGSYRVNLLDGRMDLAGTNSVEHIRILSTSGAVLLQEDLHTPAGSTVVGTAYQIASDNGVGFGIEYGVLREGSIPSGTLLLFSDNHGRLKKVPEQINFEGMLEHFPDAGFQKRRLVGDRAMYQLWAGYFFVLSSDSIRFDTGHVVPHCIDRCTLPVYPSTAQVTRTTEIEVSDTLGGLEHQLQVAEGARVELLDAYVPNTSSLKGEQVPAIAAPTLHFKFAGQTYWTKNPKSLEALGLQYKKRADQS